MTNSSQKLKKRLTVYTCADARPWFTHNPYGVQTEDNCCTFPPYNLEKVAGMKPAKFGCRVLFLLFFLGRFAVKCSFQQWNTALLVACSVHGYHHTSGKLNNDENIPPGRLDWTSNSRLQVNVTRDKLRLKCSDSRIRHAALVYGPATPTHMLTYGLFGAVSLAANLANVVCVQSFYTLIQIFTANAGSLSW